MIPDNIPQRSSHETDTNLNEEGLGLGSGLSKINRMVDRFVYRIEHKAIKPSIIYPVARRLNFHVRQLQIRSGDKPSYRSITGVVVIETAAFDFATGLMLTDLRDHSSARIILLSGDQDTEQRIAARIHGADHVVDARAGERELAAILRNELRHEQTVRAGVRAGEEDQHWRLDQEGWSLIAPNGRSVRLTYSEFQILDLLMAQAGQVQSRATLRAAVNGNPRCERVLDAVLSRLRRKVWDCANMELPLRSARREGYVFACAAVATSAPQS